VRTYQNSYCYTRAINIKYFDRTGTWRETRSLRHWLLRHTTKKLQSAVCGAIYYVIIIKHKTVNTKYYDCMHLFVSYPSGKMYLNLKILPKALIINNMTECMWICLNYPTCKSYHFCTIPELCYIVYGLFAAFP